MVQLRSTGGGSTLSALFVQTDGTIVVDSTDADYEVVRPELTAFSELVQQADRLHVYRITPVSLWQACATGMSPHDVLGLLRSYSDTPIPYAVQEQIVVHMQRWGQLRMSLANEETFRLSAVTGKLPEVIRAAKLRSLGTRETAQVWQFPLSSRAEVKRRLANAGYPCVDQIGYQDAASISASLRPATLLREYQEEAVSRFLTHQGGHSGVVVLPCGSGKTLVGIAALIRLQLETLILTPTETSAKQWIREIMDRTTLDEGDIGLYDAKDPLRAVTVTTYQRIAAHTRKGKHTHWERLTAYPWGFVIYDEVHMLPAPLFRLAADMQSVRRLGLTATLIREDGAETDVFSLIGPKVFEAQWKQLETDGFLAEVECKQIRILLPSEGKLAYARAGPRERHKIAALNPNKLEVMQKIVEHHSEAQVLVIGHYLEHLKIAAEKLKCPLICGDMSQLQREFWFNEFRTGHIRCLALSRVANMAVDIPSASIAVQLSGLYGSRQEEAQRLGRLLRPDSGPGVFYTLVSTETIEEEMARHRSLFLMEQGYAFEITDWPTEDAL